MKCHMNCPVEVSVFLAELLQTHTKEFLRDVSASRYFKTSLLEFLYEIRVCKGLMFLFLQQLTHGSVQTHKNGVKSSIVKLVK